MAGWMARHRAAPRNHRSACAGSRSATMKPRTVLRIRIWPRCRAAVIPPKGEQRYPARNKRWCPGRGSNPYALSRRRRILSPLRLPVSPPGRVRDYAGRKTKGPASPRGLWKFWRRGPESNWPGRICNPLHNRFATAPCRPMHRCTGPRFSHIGQRPCGTGSRCEKGKHRCFPL